MLPDQLFCNTGIHLYLVATNDKPISHKNRVMIIDARQQHEKEPTSLAVNATASPMPTAWIEHHYRDGWMKDYSDECVKFFRREDFAYHKVKVVFWQFDEHDKPATITEPYEKAFTAANLKKEQEFYDSDLTFRVHMKVGNTEKIETLTISPKDNTTKKIKALIDGSPELLAVEWTHRHYVRDDEYIPHGDIARS